MDFFPPRKIILILHLKICLVKKIKNTNSIVKQVSMDNLFELLTENRINPNSEAYHEEMFDFTGKKEYVLQLPMARIQQDWSQRV